MADNRPVVTSSNSRIASAHTLGWAIEDYNPAGAVGNAAAATAERGAAMVGSSAQGLVQLLQEIHALPLGTVGQSPKPL